MARTNGTAGLGSLIDWATGGRRTEDRGCWPGDNDRSGAAAGRRCWPEPSDAPRDDVNPADVIRRIMRGDWP